MSAEGRFSFPIWKHERREEQNRSLGTTWSELDLSTLAEEECRSLYQIIKINWNAHGAQH